MYEEFYKIISKKYTSIRAWREVCLQNDAVNQEVAKGTMYNIGTNDGLIKSNPKSIT